ncbi:MAG TPA: hypothetical protein EYG67_00505 [Campylobacterales bacterium]|nr:hypothetical protein [Campylobacterales bacterium]HIP41081.1 hypothetical protein [Campylobacterales bacterium]
MIKLFFILSLGLFHVIGLSAQELNLGKIDHQPYIQEDSNFSNSFNKAFIGIPKGVLGIGEAFYGTYDEALVKFPNLKSYLKKLPTVLYMQGSETFKKGKIFREWLTKEGYFFFAPNTHTTKNRPTYSSPVPKAHYEKVHAYRQAEISQFVSRIKELPFVDLNRTFLMGYSEGALAAARYSGDEFLGRIILSWSCEGGYYTDYPKVGANQQDDPFLNIIGQDDPYFREKNPWNSAYDNKGHCGDALFKFKHAKVVLLPNIGHDITQSPFTKNEILNFIDIFKNHRIKKSTFK